MSTAGKCERHQVWTWQMAWVDINDNRPAQQLCPLCVAADLADLKELTNRRIAPILEQIEKFRIELSELGLRTDNHNKSRKADLDNVIRHFHEQIERLKQRPQVASWRLAVGRVLRVITEAIDGQAVVRIEKSK